MLNLANKLKNNKNIIYGEIDVFKNDLENLRFKKLP